jgi:hypothetical protein
VLDAIDDQSHHVQVLNSKMIGLQLSERVPDEQSVTAMLVLSSLKNDNKGMEGDEKECSSFLRCCDGL